MASLYTRPNSSYFWVKWKNPASGKQERFSTGITTTNPSEKRHAIHIKNQYALKESSGIAAKHSHAFALWVDPFLRAQFRSSPQTLKKYLSIWRLINAHLENIGVFAPNQLKREHCKAYITWRGEKTRHLNGKKKNSKPVCINTILTELRVLSRIMTEAMDREYVEYNPCHRLGVRRDPPAVKSEITDEQYKIIEAALDKQKLSAETPKEKQEANFMAVSFKIAKLQGLRLSETHINLRDAVNWQTNIATIHAKGRKTYEINLNPALVPFLKELLDAKKSGPVFTYDRPKMYRLLWFKFFDKLRKKHPGFENISFHSTRVTVVSRLERAGAPEVVTMNIVNHASTTVHRVYRRLDKEELLPYWSALSSDSSSGDKPVPA